MAAIAAMRLLMLTGCRKSELLTLRWTGVDLNAGEFNLADAKFGRRAVQLPPVTVQLLTTLSRRKDSPWVFPGNDREGHYSADGLDRVRQIVRARTGLEDVRLHDLRHSFAPRTLVRGTLTANTTLTFADGLESRSRFTVPVPFGSEMIMAVASGARSSSETDRWWRPNANS